jgi:hypothetical protein
MSDLDLPQIWGQKFPDEEFTKEPPPLPPHLRQIILNKVRHTQIYLIYLNLKQIILATCLQATLHTPSTSSRFTHHLPPAFSPPLTCTSLFPYQSPGGE